MPSRAARWISWMTLRSKTADSRRPGCQPAIRGGPRRWRSGSRSILPGVVDVEVVEAARRPVPPELRRVRVHARARGQVAQLGDVLLAQLLLDAVGPEAAHRAADVQARLV